MIRPWDRSRIASSGAPRAAVLAKSTRKDPADLGEPEQLLDSPTYEGFPIRPLYTILDAQPEAPLPGRWPYTRGGDALRDVKSGWKVAETFPAPGQVSVVDGNGAVLAALTEGTSALILKVGPDGVSADELDRLLEGVFLELVPVVLDAGTDFAAAADAVLALVTDLDDERRARLSVDLGADPLTATLSGRAAPSTDEVLATAAKVAYDGGVRAITVDGPAFHDLGANASWELAGAVAAGVSYLRLLADSGIPAPEALRQISFRFAADDDQFMTIAKLRAARQLWARVAEVVGAPTPAQRPCTRSHRKPMMAQRDPWVNMLRTTVAAFAAGVGGADTVPVHTFDSAIPGGWPGTAASFARRMARNTQLLLLEESHIGRVLDPAAARGSSKTSPALAEEAWKHFRDIESRGGFAAATDYLADQIAEVARSAATISPTGGPRSPASTSIRTSPKYRCPMPIRSPVCALCGGFRSAAGPFRCVSREARVAADRLLLPLGPLAEHNIRTTFAANLLASGGVEAVNPGPWTPRGRAGDCGCRWRRVAVICGTDARYGAEASGVVDAARAAGVAQVYLAGPEKAVADADPQTGRLPDRQDRRDRRAVGPAHTIGGLR